MTVVERNPAHDLVSRVRSDEFTEQVRLALPENVPAARFVRATVTALLQNPDLAKADQGSIFISLLRCAQDGLLPDGREAALVVFGNKATYMPMIGGLRAIAAEYGWSIRTQVVYENDGFEYELGLNPTLTHRPVSPGSERGNLFVAYAVATHRDGRQEVEVMTAQDIAKVRNVSRSKDRGPWVDWEERMWEKTVGRRIFAKLALSDRDERVTRVLDAASYEPREAAAMLYGPTVVDRETGEITSSGAEPAATGSDYVGEQASLPGRESAPDETAGEHAADTAPDEPTAVAATPESQQTGGSVSANPGPSAPGLDPGEEPPVEEQGAVLIPVFGDGRSPRIGKPLADADGKFVGWALRKEAAQPTYFPPSFVTALEQYAQANHPNVWTAVKGTS